MSFCRRRLFPEGSISRCLKMLLRLWSALSLLLVVPLVSDACFTEERMALLQISVSLLGTSTTGASAGRTPPSWLETDDCCSWEGVACSNDTRRVSRLHLSLLNGDLPEDGVCRGKLNSTASSISR
ncbi:unnamed protein product [Urochloa humidicola]